MCHDGVLHIFDNDLVLSEEKGLPRKCLPWWPWC